MLAWGCFLNLTHLEISILHLNPSQALFDLHLYGPVLHVFKVTIFLSVLLDYFLTV